MWGARNRGPGPGDYRQALAGEPARGKMPSPVPTLVSRRRTKPASLIPENVRGQVGGSKIMRPLPFPFPISLSISPSRFFEPPPRRCVMGVVKRQRMEACPAGPALSPALRAIPVISFFRSGFHWSSFSGSSRGRNARNQIRGGLGAGHGGPLTPGEFPHISTLAGVQGSLSGAAANATDPASEITILPTSTIHRAQ